MKKRMAAGLLCLFLFSINFSVSAQGTDTGKYTAAECLQAQSASYKGDIPAVYAKIDKYDTGMGGSMPSDYKSWEIEMYRIDYLQSPFFAAYSKFGSLRGARSEFFHYDFKLTKDDRKIWGWVGLGDYTPCFGPYAEFPNQFGSLNTIAEMIDSEMGKVNSIVFISVYLEVMTNALLISIESDQNSYIIPYNLDTSYCHLENGKVYTEKRVMTILTTFLEDYPYTGFDQNGEKIFGAGGTVEKHPTDAQIAALGLSDIELHGETKSLPQSQAQGSYQAPSYPINSSSQASSSVPLPGGSEWGTVGFIILELGLAITVGVLIWQRVKKKKKK